MLTKGDLKQIREVIREEVGNEVGDAKDGLESAIRMSRMQLESGQHDLNDRMKNVEIKITKMHKELKEEIKLVSHVLDKENMRKSKRVKKIEEHLGFASLD